MSGPYRTCIRCEHCGLLAFRWMLHPDTGKPWCMLCIVQPDQAPPAKPKREKRRQE